MKQIINARIILPDRIIENGSIAFDDRITSVSDGNERLRGAAVTDACGATVIPGLIDLHIHGYMGEDCSDGSAKGIERIAEGIAKNGVTAFLPTTMTLSYAELEKAFDAIRRARAGGTKGGAEILGAHAEGPFINPNRCGAQPKEYAVAPDADFALKHSDIIRIITVAPETDSDFEFIRKIRAESDMVLSIGHTTADFATAKAAMDAGISHATHLFNAMTGLNHREPGTVGAALSSDKVSCEMICDTFHISPALFPVVSKLKGDKFILITDCMRAAGLSDGSYDLGGQTVYVTGIRCLLPDGVIAGSVLKLNQAVYNAIQSGISVCEAVNAATLNPAKVLGLDSERGSLEAGKRADIVICDECFNVKNVYRGGKMIV